MMTNSPSEPPARRGRPGYDKQGVLEVAVAVFNEHGYEATSMGLLADRLGMSKAGIYHHFPAKTELLRAALGQALDGLEGVLHAVPAADPSDETSAVKRLEFVVRGAARVLIEQLPSVTLLLRVRGNTDVEREALERRRRFDREMTRIVKAARDEGSLRAEVDPGVATKLIFGMINSLTEWYRPAGPEPVDRIVDDVLTVALDGLRAR